MKNQISSAASLAQTILQDFQLKNIEETYEPGCALSAAEPLADENDMQLLADEYDEAKIHLRTHGQSEHIIEAEREAVTHWSKE